MLPVLPALPEPVLPEPVLPEPMPLLLGVEEVPPAPEPVLLPAAPVPPGVEEVVPPEEAPPTALPVLPDELLPLVTLLSRRHFSRSVPVMPRHLLELLLLAPPEAESLLDDPALDEPVALGDDEAPDEVLGDEVLGDDALGVELDAPDELLGVDALSLALLVVSALLAPEDDEPAAELCAIAALERASSAAAVAEQISFNVIWTSSFNKGWGDCGALHAIGMPERILFLRWHAFLLCSAPCRRETRFKSAPRRPWPPPHSFITARRRPSGPIRRWDSFFMSTACACTTWNAARDRRS